MKSYEKLTPEGTRDFLFEESDALRRIERGLSASAGVRETSIYGIPAIDVGTRQKGRYSTEYSQNIQHVSEDKDEILQAIEHIEDFRKQGALFGKGNSTKQFLEIVHDKNIWEHGIQKVFIPSRCIIYTNNFHLFWSYFITNDKDLLAPSPLFGDFCQ